MLTRIRPSNDSNNNNNVRSSFYFQSILIVTIIGTIFRFLQIVDFQLLLHEKIEENVINNFPKQEKTSTAMDDIDENIIIEGKDALKEDILDSNPKKPKILVSYCINEVEQLSAVSFPFFVSYPVHI
jgi:hypothetical protein